MQRRAASVALAAWLPLTVLASILLAACLPCCFPLLPGLLLPQLAQDFRPERWLTQARQAEASGSLDGAAAEAAAATAESLGRPSGVLTFSAGPHVCLGLSLFMSEAKTLLALLARSYDLHIEQAAQQQQGAGPVFDVTFVSQLSSTPRVRFTRRAPMAASAPAAPVAAR